METYRKKEESNIKLTKQHIKELKEMIELYKYQEKPNEEITDPNLIETLE